jgi:hypothetical protein
LLKTPETQGREKGLPDPKPPIAVDPPRGGAGICRLGPAKHSLDGTRKGWAALFGALALFQGDNVISHARTGTRRAVDGGYGRRNHLIPYKSISRAKGGGAVRLIDFCDCGSRGFFCIPPSRSATAAISRLIRVNGSGADACKRFNCAVRHSGDNASS